MTHKRFRGGTAFLMALIFIVAVTGANLAAGLVLIFVITMIAIFIPLIRDSVWF